MRNIRFITLINNLILVSEKYDTALFIEIIDFVSLLSILCAVFVIITRNPIVSVLFLIGLFCTIATYLILLGINFIALSYLLVYVGAVSILFLFILMLINIRISELVNDNSNGIPLVIVVSVYFNMSIYKLISNNLVAANYTNNYRSVDYLLNREDSLLLVTSKCWDTNLAETDHIAGIGNVMYSNYSILLIIASVVLLLAMVGAIVITIRQKC